MFYASSSNIIVLLRQLKSCTPKQVPSSAVYRKMLESMCGMLGDAAEVTAVANVISVLTIASRSSL